MTKVLVVDDDRDILVMVQALMELQGHAVAVCESALEGIELARREKFNLIITDANMTPHSGYDLIRTIRTIPTYDLVPIAMLTARKTKKDVERAVLVGAQDYIVKPINPDLLLKKVRDLLERAQSAQLASRFGELSIDFEGTIGLAFKIVGITETGIVMNSELRFREGTHLKISSSLFDHIGILTPQLRVQTVSAADEEGLWSIRASFQGLDQRSMSKVRHYLQNGFLRKKAS